MRLGSVGNLSVSILTHNVDHKDSRVAWEESELCAWPFGWLGFEVLAKVLHLSPQLQREEKWHLAAKKSGFYSVTVMLKYAGWLQIRPSAFLHLEIFTSVGFYLQLNKISVGIKHKSERFAPAAVHLDRYGVNCPVWTLDLSQAGQTVV